MINDGEEEVSASLLHERSDLEQEISTEVSSGPSNIYLLAVVCVLFGGFAISELIAAVVSNSLSLLGDAMSMIVDSITYGLNMFAEKEKGKDETSERRKLKLEFFIPLISVVALTATSIYLIVEAGKTIANPPSDATTGDAMMLGFSIANLLIDFVSLFCFARVNRLLGFKSVDDGEGEASNTNMCSAYTHVIADTLRSIAVLIAATVSLSSKSVNPDLADAWAAIVVSIVIFVSILPLLSGLKQKYEQLRK